MQLRPSGKCRLCGKTFGGSGIGRHIGACLKKNRCPASKGASYVRQNVLHVAVTANPYWMHLLVPSKQPLAQLDLFLRDIWLECCGHLSSFEIDGMRYDDDPNESMEWCDTEVRSKETPVDEAMPVGASGTYEYDFGTTTQLLLRTIGQHTIESPKDNIVILARNAPLDFNCCECGKRAELLCGQCMYSTERSVYCDDCADQHECGEEMLRPITNSPRMGQCAYTGETDQDADAYGALPKTD